MSVVILGVSHHTAPIDVLESLALRSEQVERFAAHLGSMDNVGEVVVLATCNRLEVYAAAETFHGAVSEIVDALAAITAVPRAELSPYLYVHYGDRAIAHVFTVASGLDSMAVGDAQILGQLRESLRRAQAAGRVGPTLNGLLQHALHVGKRAHAETTLDRVSVSLVEAGLGQAECLVGPLALARVLVVGAGSMSSLAAKTVARAGCAELVISNRTTERGVQLAQQTGARHRGLDALAEELALTDVVVSCTGAVGHVVDTEMVAAAQGRHDGPQLYLDLALPRDVDPAAARIPGVHVLSLAELGDLLAGPEQEVAAVRTVQDLVTGEVAAYLANRRMQDVAPTVAALRYRASQVMASELGRLESRLPDLSESAQEEVRHAVHRVVEKLLHTPTVRVKELAGSDHAGDYAQALRELFDLDPYDVAAVSAPPKAQGLA